MLISLSWATFCLRAEGSVLGGEEGGKKTQLDRNAPSKSGFYAHVLKDREQVSCLLWARFLRGTQRGGDRPEGLPWAIPTPESTLLSCELRVAGGKHRWQMGDWRRVLGQEAGGCSNLGGGN